MNQTDTILTFNKNSYCLTLRLYNGESIRYYQIEKLDQFDGTRHENDLRDYSQFVTAAYNYFKDVNERLIYFDNKQKEVSK